MSNFNLRHSICIVEQIDDRRGGEYHETIEVAMIEACNFVLLPNYKSFKEYLQYNYPQYDWQADDGEDWDVDKRTDYCQYCCYLNKVKSHCILATYNYNKEG